MLKSDILARLAIRVEDGMSSATTVNAFKDLGLKFEGDEDVDKIKFVEVGCVSWNNPAMKTLTVALECFAGWVGGN